MDEDELEPLTEELLANWELLGDGNSIFFVWPFLQVNYTPVHSRVYGQHKLDSVHFFLNDRALSE